jgi:hypothetical protein
MGIPPPKVTENIQTTIKQPLFYIKTTIYNLEKSGKPVTSSVWMTHI